MPWPISDRRWEINSERSEQTLDGVESLVTEYVYIEGSGNMDEMHGYWVVQPWPDDPEYTLVKYVVNADLGVALPRSIINWAARRMLPGIIDGLQGRHDDLH